MARRTEGLPEHRSEHDLSGQRPHSSHLGLPAYPYPPPPSHAGLSNITHLGPAPVLAKGDKSWLTFFLHLLPTRWQPKWTSSPSPRPSYQLSHPSSSTETVDHNAGAAQGTIHRKI